MSFVSANSIDLMLGRTTFPCHTKSGLIASITIGFFLCTVNLLVILPTFNKQLHFSSFYSDPKRT